MSKQTIYLISFVLVLGLVLTSVAKADLVGWWKFDEGSGTTAHDSSGNGNDGTLYNMTGNEWTNGIVGGALEFDGTDHYVSVPNSSGLQFTSALTMAGWIKGDSWGSGTNVDIIARKGEGNPNNYQLAIADGLATLHFDEGDGGGYRGDTLLNTGQWYHVAATWDGTTVRIYVDGVLDNAPPDSHGGPIGTDTRPFYMGGRSGSDLFDGTLDDIRVYSRALTAEEIQLIMKGPLGPASHPNPADGQIDVSREVVLGWTPGEFAPPASGHKVYLSENLNDVTGGVGGVTQDANSYTPPQRLDFSTTYYWRVDEVNGPPDYTVYEGSLWSFTTEPFAYSIENITATASSSDAAKGPENTVNGSGLDDSGLLHGRQSESMWLSGAGGPQPTWIQYEFDKVHKLHEMWVWNSNESLEPAIGLGFKDVTIEYSSNGTDYTTLGTTAEFARAPGAADYEHNTTIDMGGVPAKYVRLTANSNWGGILNQYGLSEVRFFHIPVHAKAPYPDLGATGVPLDVVLDWNQGREAATHDVYLSTDEQAVIDGTAPVSTVAESSYGPLDLDLGKTYYWRVDEVNEVETPATWQGELWNFRAQEYFVVDDIESYNDLDPGDPESNRIFNAWLDGYGVATNGSLVGYENPPFAEQSIVHSGAQSMPFFYDNSGTARYSEATLTLSSQRDWTLKAVETLVLWFKGNPAGFVEGPAGTYTINAAGVDIWDTSDEFRYVWKQLSGDGEIVAQVLSVDNTHDFAKAGVMIRNTLDADSANAMAFITPSGRAGWQYRDVAAGISVSTRSNEGVITAPHWVKLTRQGNTITAKHSSDGVNWEDMVETDNPQEPSFRKIVMNPDLYVGLALTSHVAGVTCEAKFSDVQTTGMVSGQFTEQAIGVDMPGSDPAPMYVALANVGGTPAVVYHDDPNATQINAWMEWPIDLKQFADQGVNLTNVNTISIGFGDKNSMQAGGSGTVYFDDIRLYPAR